MAIRKWHYGKIVLLWTWGAILTAFSVHQLQSVKDTMVVFSWICVAFIIPLTLSVITWKWLGAKED